jgi:hypothetical protein
MSGAPFKESKPPVENHISASSVTGYMVFYRDKNTSMWMVVHKMTPTASTTVPFNFFLEKTDALREGATQSKGSELKLIAVDFEV